MSPPVPARPPTIRRLSLLAVAILIASLIPGATTAAAEVLPASSADEVLVRYRAGTTPLERARVALDHGLTAVRTSPDGRTQVVVAEGRSPATARRQLNDDPRVLAVANNALRETTDDITAEPFFSDLWGLHNTGQTVDGESGIADVDIDGLEALRIEQGDSDIVVAVIDDGVDFSHPDLIDRKWTNPGESGAGKETNGLDDDDNGHIDDVNGWDFCHDDNTLFDNEPAEGHGTHVAGTIAASLNGTGVVGVAPGIKIMALKFISNSPSCAFFNDDEAIDAIDYAKSFNVPIINASWGGPDPDLVLDAAIGESGALFVAAAGNNGWNLDSGSQKFYPAVSTQPNVLTVAAIDQQGDLASFSNYGTTSVDLSAPGVNIISSYRSGGYAWAAGTSMAAPHVSGVAALVASVLTGTPTPAVLRQRLLSSATTLTKTLGKTVTGKLVNARLALDGTGPVASAIDRHGINVGTILGTNTISTAMTWPAATDDLTGVLDYQVQRSANGGTFGTFTASTTKRSTTRDLVFGTQYRFRLRARDQARNYGAPKDGPIVTASLVQDHVSSTTAYTGKWSLVTSSAASNGKLHRSTKGGASVTFTTNARAIAVVGRKGPTNGQAKIYVDGVYAKTINLHRSSTLSKVIVFNVSWTSAAVHSVKVVVAGTTGHSGVEVDAFAILR